MAENLNVPKIQKRRTQRFVCLGIVQQWYNDTLFLPKIQSIVFHP